LRYLKERELVDQNGSLDYAVGDELAVPRAARHYYSLDLDLGSSCVSEPTGRKSPVAVLESTSPGEEDSTGAGAERELGFDPQLKAELAQGE
jgi:hypothetical protein